VHRAQPLRGQEGEGRLVEASLVESDGEGAQLRLVPSCESDDRGRVDASGEKRADRNIGDEAAHHRGIEQPEELLPRLLRSPGERRGSGKLPVPLDPEPGSIEQRQVRGGQLEHVPVDAPRSRNVLQREIATHGLGVELSRDRGVLAERLELAGEDASGGLRVRGGEEPPAGRQSVIEGLLAQAVAREEETANTVVPDRQGEHPVNPLDEARPPLEIRAQDDLGVAASGEEASLATKLLAEGGVLVGLTIEEQHHSLANHGLRPCLQIEDRQPAVSQGCGGVDVEALSIRSAVGQRPGHPPQRLAIRRGLEIDVAADPAHRYRPVARSGPTGVPGTPFSSSAIR